MAVPSQVQLNYMPSDGSRSYRRRVRRAFVWAILIGALMAGLDKLIAHETEIRVDPITGSMSTQTIWVFGITTEDTVGVSPIDARLKRMGIPRTPTWECITSYDVSMFGSARGCGIAPPIYALRPVLKEYADASTDAELKQFVHVMQFGSAAQQRTAIDAAGDKALSSR